MQLPLFTKHEGVVHSSVSKFGFCFTECMRHLYSLHKCSAYIYVPEYCGVEGKLKF